VTRIVEHREDAAAGEEVFELRVFQLKDGDVRKTGARRRYRTRGARLHEAHRRQVTLRHTIGLRPNSQTLNCRTSPDISCATVRLGRKGLRRVGSIY